jgi:reactive intermediate/imine deaminase
MPQQSAVRTCEAPAPLPQFSQAVKYDGLLFCSGSIGMDPATNKLIEGTTKDRARWALRNLQSVIEADGSSMYRVLKATVFLNNMSNFPMLNEAWDEFFSMEPKPVSSKSMC